MRGVGEGNWSEETTGWEKEREKKRWKGRDGRFQASPRLICSSARLYVSRIYFSGFVHPRSCMHGVGARVFPRVLCSVVSRLRAAIRREAMATGMRKAGRKRRKGGPPRDCVRLSYLRIFAQYLTMFSFFLRARISSSLLPSVL